MVLIPLQAKKPHFTTAVPDALNLGILDPSGELALTPHGIYIDNDIYLDLADHRRFEQATAAGIEAVFILLSESDITLRQDPILSDKLHELLVAPVNRILGLILDLHHLTISTPPEFIAATVKLLQMTWDPHHHSFKVKEAEELTGKLNHIVFSAPWLKY